MRKLKLYMALVLFIKTICILTAIVVLSIQKRSIPRAVALVLGGCGICSALLLFSYNEDVKAHRRMKNMDAFYDYESDYLDDEYDFEDESPEDEWM